MSTNPRRIGSSVPLFPKLMAATVVSVVLFIIYFGFTLDVFVRNNHRLAQARDIEFPALELVTEQVADLERVIDAFDHAVSAREPDEIASASAIGERIRRRWARASELGGPRADDFRRLAREFDVYDRAARTLCMALLSAGPGRNRDGIVDMQHALSTYERDLSSLRQGLHASFAASVDQVTRESNRATVSGLAIATIGLAACLFFGVAIALSVTRRIKSVVRSFHDVAHDSKNLAQRLIVNGHDEMAELQSWFNVFVEKLQADVERRIDAEDRLRKVGLAVEQSPHGIAIVDLTGKIEYVNRAYCRMIGYSAVELGRLRWQDLRATGPEVPPWEAIRARLAGDDAWVGEAAMRRRDESEFCSELRLSTISSDRGSATHVLVFQKDITERKRIETELLHYRDDLETLVEQRTAELAFAKEAAESANRAKSEFVANMSHEMRTPMHAILSFSTMGLRKALVSDTTKDRLHGYFARIDDSGRRLMRLLNDLLDLSKLESGSTHYDFGVCHLRSLVDALFSELRLLARERGIELEVEEPEGNLHAWCDGGRMEQVLRNLLSNAIKFSPGDARVTVTIGRVASPAESAGPAMVLVSVADQGVGIPDGELDAIFGKFVQSSRTRTGAGGIGLGLAIAHEIVHQHGGRIWAENRECGGARFCVTVPLAPAADVVEVAA